MTKRTKRGKDGGFTLLEVLVALALVAVAAVGILALSNDLFRLMGNARNMDSLALLAQEVAYRHGTGLRHPAYKEGECDPPNNDCRWTIRTESAGESGLALMRLTVECGWGETFTLESAVTALGGA